MEANAIPKKMIQNCRDNRVSKIDMGNFLFPLLIQQILKADISRAIWRLSLIKKVIRIYLVIFIQKMDVAGAAPFHAPWNGMMTIIEIEKVLSAALKGQRAVHMTDASPGERRTF